MRGRSWEIPLLNPDFRDMLSALCDEEVEFLLVGAYALAVQSAAGCDDIRSFTRGKREAVERPNPTGGNEPVTADPCSSAAT